MLRDHAQHVTRQKRQRRGQRRFAGLEHAIAIQVAPQRESPARRGWHGRGRARHGQCPDAARGVGVAVERGRSARDTRGCGRRPQVGRDVSETEAGVDRARRRRRGDRVGGAVVAAGQRACAATGREPAARVHLAHRHRARAARRQPQLERSGRVGQRRVALATRAARAQQPHAAEVLAVLGAIGEAVIRGATPCAVILEHAALEPRTGEQAEVLVREVGAIHRGEHGTTQVLCPEPAVRPGRGHVGRIIRRVEHDEPRAAGDRGERVATARAVHADDLRGRTGARRDELRPQREPGADLADVALPVVVGVGIGRARDRDAGAHRGDARELAGAHRECGGGGQPYARGHTGRHGDREAEAVRVVGALVQAVDG